MLKQTMFGQFWLPDEPQHRVNGTITFDDDGGASLVTTTQDGVDLHRGGRNKHAIINGETVEHHIKLVGCFVVKENESIGQTSIASSETTWYCELAFLGEHYDGSLPSRIRSVEVHVELLEDWAVAFEGAKVERNADRWSISGPTTQPGLVHPWSLGKIAIRQTHSFQRSQTQTSVTTRTFFQLVFEQPQLWHGVTNAIGNLQALLSIAKGEAVRITGVSLVEEGNPHANLSAHYRPILRTNGNPIAHSELLTMNELGGIAGVGEWLNVLHHQGALIHGLLIDRYKPPPFVTDRTSHLLLACEAYQRRTMADPSRQVQLRRDILEPMASRAGPSFQAWTGNKDAWTKKIAEVRNRHGVAHLQGYGGVPADGGDIHTLNEQLYVLVIICLLLDCGCPAKLLDQVTERARSKWKVLL